jgi:hypothetical protein
MKVDRTNAMTTRSLVAKYAAATALFLLGSSSAVFAEEVAQPAAEPPAPPAAQTESAKAPAPTPAEAAKAEGVAAAGPNAEPPKPSEEPPLPPDPPFLQQIGVQRLPGYSYPELQTRGLPYGSLSLTFHGMQWPYMPAMEKGQRFVLGISGWGWVDTAYQKFAPWGENPNLSNSRSTYWKQQARLVGRFTPTYSLGDGWFIQGQAEFVATEDQTASRSDVGGADTDDLWLRFGQWNKWDLQVGRFEGWEVFHLGMGLDQNTFERMGAFGQGDTFNPGFYGLTDNQFRPQGAAGNMAFHYYPLRILRVELLGMAGSFSGNPTWATRPVAILDLGWLKLKAGVEYTKAKSQHPDNAFSVTQKGVGGAIQFVFLPHIEFGLNAAQGTVWSINGKGEFDAKGSLTRTSVGGFANISNGSRKYPLLLGVGSLYTQYDDQNSPFKNGVVDKYWQLQNFVALQYVAFQQLYIKLVAGYARGHWITADDDPPITYDDEMYSVRLRFFFYF